MDFENAGEGKSEGAGVNGIGVRTKRTKEHRQIDIHYVTVKQSRQSQPHVSRFDWEYLYIECRFNK